MSRFDILQHPHTVLAQPCATVADFKDIVKQCWAMVGACRDNKGVGLAWPQLGFLTRAFVYAPYHSSKERVFFNPTWQPCHWPSEQATTMAAEGCLSLEHGRARFAIERPYRILASYTEIIEWWSPTHARTLEHAGTMAGWEARVFQHESDHLDGRLIDRPADDGKKTTPP